MISCPASVRNLDDTSMNEKKMNRLLSLGNSKKRCFFIINVVDKHNFFVVTVFVSVSLS